MNSTLGSVVPLAMFSNFLDLDISAIDLDQYHAVVSFLIYHFHFLDLIISATVDEFDFRGK